MLELLWQIVKFAIYKVLSGGCWAVLVGLVCGAECLNLNLFSSGR